MAYKRQIDRLPIIPKDAKEFNVTCHYCIVGCGYKAYTWPTNKQGGTAADQNTFGVDLGKQQPAETDAWYSPAMYNIVRQNGDDVHIVNGSPIRWCGATGRCSRPAGRMRSTWSRASPWR